VVVVVVVVAADTPSLGIMNGKNENKHYIGQKLLLQGRQYHAIIVIIKITTLLPRQQPNDTRVAVEE